MPELEINTQDLLDIIGNVYDDVSDASCLLYDLIQANPMLGDVHAIKKLQKALDKAIHRIEGEMP